MIKMIYEREGFNNNCFLSLRKLVLKDRSVGIENLKGNFLF